ncbi:MAG: tRNA (adenosine(37)-N6)-threonylcarbamoyltransferase complex ATPase subunit type 1 TsaE [Candidatus Acidiferrales bacterium]
MLLASEIITHSAEETLECGRKIGRHLRAPVLIRLTGELGAGKTTLVKGIVSGLGAACEDEVTSPTFTLVHLYRNGARVYHVDLYRVADSRDFATLGLDDIFCEPSIVLVEWAEKLSCSTDWPVVEVHLSHVDDSSRSIFISGLADSPSP